ncbi:MAG: hypothetical protein JWQ73_1879 [Variovorax sp.]|nr:hypothetical protein [Variovorax sp.]
MTKSHAPPEFTGATANGARPLNRARLQDLLMKAVMGDLKRLR